MRKALTLAVLGALLAGCAREITTTVAFDPAEVAFFDRRGTGVIEGQAFMRQAGGGVVTCAGTDVFLQPAGRYAVERITAIYGHPDGGRINFLSGASNSGDAAYQAKRRSATCDAQGNFVFADLAPGSYYLISQVTWAVGGRILPEGGTIARRVTVAPGQRQRVILS